MNQTTTLDEKEKIVASEAVPTATIVVPPFRCIRVMTRAKSSKEVENQLARFFEYNKFIPHYVSPTTTTKVEPGTIFVYHEVFCGDYITCFIIRYLSKNKKISYDLWTSQLLYKNNVGGKPIRMFSSGLNRSHEIPEKMEAPLELMIATIEENENKV